MNKTVVGVIVAIFVLGGVGFAAMNMNKKDDAKDDTATSQSTDNSNNTPSANTPSSSADTQPTTPATTNNATADVEIKNSDFSPKTITIKVGTKVTWTNKDSLQHDVATDKNYGDDFKSSELLSRGETYSFTFNKAGTYTYHCTPHPFMRATVVVTE